MISRNLSFTPSQQLRYQIKVQGKLDQTRLQNFQGLTTDYDGRVTTLTSVLADQSALRGLLCYLWDFNLTILSVALVEHEENQPDINCLEERK